MKAKELMLGDWVHVIDVNWNLKVASICTRKFSDWYGTDEYNIITTNYDVPGYGDYIESKEHEVEPIPITPEILDKNGWDMYGCPDHKCWEHYHGAFEYGKQHVPFSICLFDFMNKGSMYCDDLYEQIIIHVRFVHELQHALRLCGLNELADNFKI